MSGFAFTYRADEPERKRKPHAPGHTARRRKKAAFNHYEHAARAVEDRWPEAAAVIRWLMVKDANPQRFLAENASPKSRFVVKEADQRGVASTPADPDQDRTIGVR